jgi:hypothetical protein
MEAEQQSSTGWFSTCANSPWNGDVFDSWHHEGLTFSIKKSNPTAPLPACLLP